MAYRVEERSCANKQVVRRRVGKKVQRAAKRYRTTTTATASRDIGLRLLLLAAVIMAAKAPPPQTNIPCRSNDRGTTGCCYKYSVGTGRNYPLAALCRVKPDGYIIRSSVAGCFQPNK